jgi:hypothetical protein
MTLARAERKVFDIEAEIDCQPLAIWPRVVWAINDWRVSITIVIGKLHMGIPAKRGLRVVHLLMLAGGGPEAFRQAMEA